VKNVLEVQPQTASHRSLNVEHVGISLLLDLAHSSNKYLVVQACMSSCKSKNICQVS
jgi:hypothetical protein